jgi:uncharacterized spore protein YtfJ
MANLASELADKVSALGIKSVYGEPVEIGGKTVVPVAAMWFGFGAGSEDGESPAGGGGGGGATIPIGAYVEEAGSVRFQPNVIALLWVGIPFVWVAGRALARVFKALKH